MALFKYDDAIVLGYMCYKYFTKPDVTAEKIVKDETVNRKPMIVGPVGLEGDSSGGGNKGSNGTGIPSDGTKSQEGHLLCGYGGTQEGAGSGFISGDFGLGGGRAGSILTSGGGGGWYGGGSSYITAGGGGGSGFILCSDTHDYFPDYNTVVVPFYDYFFSHLVTPVLRYDFLNALGSHPEDDFVGNNAEIDSLNTTLPAQISRNSINADEGYCRIHVSDSPTSISQTTEFLYTGEVQFFSVPFLYGDTCYVTIECYGAQGGAGARGGKVRGTFLLPAGLLLAIFVGEHNTTSDTYTFNGGGPRGAQGRSGGGATDVRFCYESGAAQYILSHSVTDWRSTLHHRFIVAGGGGGCLTPSEFHDIPPSSYGDYSGGGGGGGFPGGGGSGGGGVGASGAKKYLISDLSVCHVDLTYQTSDVSIANEYIGVEIFVDGVSHHVDYIVPTHPLGQHSFSFDFDTWIPEETVPYWATVEATVKSNVTLVVPSGGLRLWITTKIRETEDTVLTETPITGEAIDTVSLVNDCLISLATIAGKSLKEFLETYSFDDLYLSVLGTLQLLEMKENTVSVRTNYINFLNFLKKVSNSENFNYTDSFMSHISLLHQMASVCEINVTESFSVTEMILELKYNIEHIMITDTTGKTEYYSGTRDFNQRYDLYESLFFDAVDMFTPAYKNYISHLDRGHTIHKGTHVVLHFSDVISAIDSVILSRVGVGFMDNSVTYDDLVVSVVSLLILKVFQDTVILSASGVPILGQLVALNYNEIINMNQETEFIYETPDVPTLDDIFYFDEDVFRLSTTNWLHWSFSDYLTLFADIFSYTFIRSHGDISLVYDDLVSVLELYMKTNKPKNKKSDTDTHSLDDFSQYSFYN